MAMTPGLRPFREDAPQRLRRDKSAIGIKDVQDRMPSLRPTAAPVDPYARPEPPAKGDPLAQLADSLGQLNPALQRFGSAYMQQKKEDTTSSVDAKLAQAGGPEAVQKLIETDPEVQTELGKSAAMRFMGKQLAAKAVQDAQTKYQNDFDRQGGNIDQFTADALKPYLDQFGKDPHFRKAFMEDVTPGMEKLRAGHAQFKSGEMYQQTQQATSDVFLGTVRKGEAAGQTPEEQAKAVFAEFYGNKKLLGLPYKDQMQALGQVVQTLANEGKYDVVKALAEMDRKSDDGGHIGKLLDNNIVGPALAQQMIHARSIRDKNVREDTIKSRQDYHQLMHEGNATPDDEKALLERAQKKDGFITEAEASSWVQINRHKREALQKKAQEEADQAALDAKLNAQDAAITNTGIEAMKTGKLFSLPQVVTLKKNGDEEVLTPDKFRERATGDFEKWSNQYAQQKGETWEQKTLRELPIYAQNGHVPQGWKDTFSAGGNAISAAASHGTDLPEPAQKAYAMYKLLRANDAAMLRDLVPKDHRDLFEAWRVGEEELHIDPKKAIIAATSMNADPTDRFNRAANSSVKQIKDAVSSNFDGYEFVKTIFGGVGNLYGGSDLSDKIGRRAEWYAKMGVSADKALELGAKSVKDSHINVNGWWIDASDKRLPKDFPSLADEMIGQYATKYGKAEGLTASDLTIREAGSGYGAWRIVRKSDGVPVDNINDAIFTPADLMSAAARRKAVEDQKVIEQQQRNSKKTVKPRNGPPTVEDMRLYD